METMKFEIISRELVKPSSPTPTHLRDYKLCLLDQFIPENHGGIIFFYSSNSNSNQNDNNHYYRILKKSLSDTLTDFYPIAGRFKDTSTIDCNDKGACVVEAKINSTLQDFLISVSQSRYYPQEKLGKLVPKLDPETMELALKCMLIAQLTVFKCGGTAICFSLEHRFCDFSSVVVFIKSWSTRARGHGGDSDHEISIPEFVASSFLPPRDLPPTPSLSSQNENRVMTRLVFEASKISELKTRFVTESGGLTDQMIKLSRVEVVLALILKSAISAAGSVTKSATKSVVFQAVNLRKRTTPPLPENSIGNLLWMVSTTVEERRIKFHEVVTKLRNETTSFYDETVGRIKCDEEGNSLVFESVKKREEILKSVADLDIYWCSSWCRFPVYEMDFGWGKPVWVTSGAGTLSRNLIVFQDTKCRSGIQAWVKLDPKVMAIFERDEELLSFASFNPYIV